MTRSSPPTAGTPSPGRARPQRPLWASTGVKDPAYADTRYVVDLVTRGVVNTMPEATLRAVADHGVVRGDTVRPGNHDAAEVMAALAEVGVDYDDVVDKLERDGLTTFQASWAALAETVEHKLAAAGAAPTVTTRRRSMPDNPHSPSLAPAWPAPRPPRHSEPRASPDASSCSGPNPTDPTSDRPVQGYLQGSAERDTVYVHPPQWYADHQIDLRRTAVTAIDRRAHESRPPTQPGALRQAAPGHRRYTPPTAGVRRRPRRLHYLAPSTTATSSRRRSAPAPGSDHRRGWIGWRPPRGPHGRRRGDRARTRRAAAAARARPQVAQVFADLHTENGVDLRCGVTPATIRPAASTRRPPRVQLTDGTTLTRRDHRRHRRHPER